MKLSSKKSVLNHPQASGARRGSVLILVIVVLVLLALLGTAYITASRSDRFAAQQNVSQTQLDVVVKGVADQVNAAIINDVIKTVGGVRTYRGTTPPATVLTPADSAYLGVTALARVPDIGKAPVGQTWLASRTPEVDTALTGGILQNSPLSPISSNYARLPYWSYVTRLANGRQFGDPSRDTLYPTDPYGNNAYSSDADDNGTGDVPTNNRWFSMPLNRLYPTYRQLQPNGPFYPAFFISKNLPDYTTAILAADADGDGVADAGLVPLGTVPGTDYAGLTFYYGVRIVDNNSAININTALTSGNDFDYRVHGPLAAPAVVRNNRFFPGAINLEGLLVQDDPARTAHAVANSPLTDRVGLNSQVISRAEGAALVTGPTALAPDYQQNPLPYFAGGDPYLGWSLAWNQANAAPNAPTWPYTLDDVRTVLPYVGQLNERGGTAAFAAEEMGGTGSGYVPETYQQLYYQQVARRLDMPGYIYDGSYTTINGSTSSPTSYRAQPLSMADGATLAARFCLTDQTANYAPRSAAENRLPYSLYRTDVAANGNFAQEGIYLHPPLPSIPYSPTVAGSNVLQRSQKGMIGVSHSKPFTAPSDGYGTLNPPGTPYQSWFSDNFDYLRFAANTTPTYLSVNNLRPLAVTRNPVSNAAPAIDALPTVATDAGMMSQYEWEGKNVGPSALPNPVTPIVVNSARYAPGDVVTDGTFGAYLFLGVGSPRAAGVVANANPPHSDLANWTPAPRVPQATKADVNQSGFNDLWRSFFLVMAGDTTDAPTTPGSLSPFYIDSSTAGVLINSNATGEIKLKTYGNETYVGNTFGAGPGFAPNATQNIHRQFRSSLRDTQGTGARSYFDPDQMVLLRSAVAAANTEGLRQGTARPAVYTSAPVHTIKLKLNPGAAAQQTVFADVFGQQPGRQVLITEVYVNTNTAANYTEPNTDPTNVLNNPTGYCAIEIYNPGPYDLDLFDWRVVALPKGVSNYTTPKNFSTDTPLPPPSTWDRLPIGANTNGSHPIVKAGQYLLIENYNAGGAGAQYRPITTGLPRIDDIVSTANLQVVKMDLSALYLGGPKELVLMRPVRSQINLVAGSPQVSFSDANVATDAFIPVDSFDFSGVATPNSTNATVYYYSRANNVAVGGQFTAAYAVYPGRYDGGNGGVHHQGTQEIAYAIQTDATIVDNVGGGSMDGQDFNTPSAGVAQTLQYSDGTPAFPSLGGYVGTAVNPYQLRSEWKIGTNIGVSSTNAKATYPRIFPVQVGQFIAPQSTGGGADELHSLPAGGFLREGDMLQIPFIGGYVIRKNTSTTYGKDVIEMNSITMDAAMAEDTDTTDDAEENIGRFTPIIAPTTPTGAPTQIFGSALTSTVDEFSPNDPASTPPNNPVGKLRYGWATKLFDHLTTRSPQMARTVLSPKGYNLDATGAALVAAGLEPLPIALTSAALSASPTASGTQDSVGVEGLININTAPLPVLASVPWVRSNVPSDDVRRNTAIAQAIINYRNSARGPFRSLFQLNEVPGLTTETSTSFRTNTIAANGVVGKYSGWGTELGVSSGTYVDPSLTHTFVAPDPYKIGYNGYFAAVPNTTPVNRLTSEMGIPGPGTLPAAPLVADQDHVPNDFSSQYLMMTAVSNLITTRSDTFTVYIVLEGWRNVGKFDASNKSLATREIQKRTSYIIDRTGITAPVDNPASISTRLKITPVPEK